MMFPKLPQIAVLLKRNPDYWQSVWLGVWVAVFSLPEVVWRAVTPWFVGLINLWGAAIFVTLRMTGKMIWLLLCTTFGMLLTGLRGLLGLVPRRP